MLSEDLRVAEDDRSTVPGRRRPWGLYAVAGAVFSFIYLPIVVLVVFAFTSRISTWPMPAFTFKWFGEIVRQPGHQGRLAEQPHHRGIDLDGLGGARPAWHRDPAP